ncbi:MAG: hypothetical protein WC712_09875 [Candidatus Brocadiia bacterium]
MNANEFETLLESNDRPEVDTRLREALDNAALFDAAIRDAVSAHPAPVRLPDRIYPVRSIRLFSPLKLLAAAAVLLIATAVAYFALNDEKLPYGDQATIDKYVASATDSNRFPSELLKSQVQFVAYVGKNYGDYVRMTNDGSMPDLDSAWLKSCAAYEKRALVASAVETSIGKRIAALEAAATECSGVVSREFINTYRTEIEDSAKLIESAMTDWRMGKPVESAWTQSAWSSAATLFAADADGGRDATYRAWRTLMEGATADEMASALKNVPRNLQMPLAELASALASRRLRYSPDFTEAPDVVCTAALKVEEKLNADSPDALTKFGYLAEMPLYSAYYFYPGTVPAKLRRSIDRVDKILQASQQAMPGRRMDALLSFLIESFKTNDRLLVNSLPQAPAMRQCNLYSEALSNESLIPEEIARLLKAVNNFRLLIGREPLCAVFSRPESTTDLKIALRFSFSDPAAFEVLKELLVGRHNRFAFGIPANDESSVVLYLFSATRPFEVPDMFRVKGAIEQYFPSFRTGDTPGKF